MLDAIIKIAQEAGKIVLEVSCSGNLDIQIKDDRSPVTRADLASDRFILQSLQKSIHIPAVSEETEIEYEERKMWDELFMIDPLDGTKDFINGSNEFTINIALIRKREPVMGVIYAPAIGELFYGEKGRGAFMLRNGEKILLPEKTSKQLIMAHSRYHDNEMMDRFAKANSITQIKKMSSAIRLSRLAQGEVNLCPWYTRSKEWDTAPGHIILKETGGRILDLITNKEPEYNKPNLKNNHFIACARGVDIKSLNVDLA